MKYLSLLLLSVIILFSSCSDVRIEQSKSWERIFENHGLAGGFELYDNNRDMANYYNLELISTPKIPGASFHVFASIIALETSTILDENKSIYWVTKMTDTSINKESNLRTFFKAHNPAFFSQLAVEVGTARMQEYIDTAKYGNMQISDKDYWQNGTLLISPDEQVGLMKKIYFNKMPNVSSRSTTIMQSMMQQVNSDALKLFYQISPVTENGVTHYWIVGFAETFNPLKNPNTGQIEKIVHPHFFAGYISSDNKTADENSVKALMTDLLADYQIAEK